MNKEEVCGRGEHKYKILGKKSRITSGIIHALPG